MKVKYLIAGAMTMACMMMAAGCAEKDSHMGAAASGTTQAGNTSNGSGVVTGNGNEQTGNPDSGQSSDQNSGATVTLPPQGNNQSGQADASASQGGDAAGEDTVVYVDGSGQSVDPNQTYDALNQTDDAAINPSQESYENDDAVWEGSYENSNGEVLTISGVDEDGVSFAFEVCGIAGKAVLQDTVTAVYNGDDHNDVVFDLGDDEIEVTVCSQEDFDNSDSPVNGVYTRQM
ncbi:MAG: hypothetical protein Q4B59_01655 [Lachnospiraceae bacterium]|nr:hypothetical protein [Lachnospiraceae bacterium]